MVSPLGDSLFGGLPVFLRMNISTFVFLSYELAHKLKIFWGAKKPQKAFVQTTRYPGARGCQKERDRERAGEPERYQWQFLNSCHCSVALPLGSVKHDLKRLVNFCNPVRSLKNGDFKEKSFKLFFLPWFYSNQ